MKAYLPARKQHVNRMGYERLHKKIFNKIQEVREILVNNLIKVVLNTVRMELIPTPNPCGREEEEIFHSVLFSLLKEVSEVTENPSLQTFSCKFVNYSFLTLVLPSSHQLSTLLKKWLYLYQVHMSSTTYTSK